MDDEGYFRATLMAGLLTAFSVGACLIHAALF